MGEGKMQPVEGATWPEKARGTAEHIAKVREKYGANTRAQFRDRPLRLHYMEEVAYQEFYGLTNKQAAEHAGVSLNTWSKVRSHATTKKLIKSVEEYRDSGEGVPVVRELLAREALHTYKHLLFCRDRLADTKNVEAAGKIDKWLLEKMGFEAKPEAPLSVTAQNITITISGNGTAGLLEETPKIPAAEYEILEDDDGTPE